MSLNSASDWLDEHRSALFLGVVIGMIGFGSLELWYSRDTKNFAADRDQHTRPSSITPWHPGSPRNPHECVQRGGIDMGRSCKGWH